MIAGSGCSKAVMRTNKPILLVEDDEIDVMTVKRALRDLNVSNPLAVATNGEEALALLRNSKSFKPAIILLDLNMPRMSGLEFLRELRSDDALRDSVVFVFTTSNAEEDKAAAYALNVAGYMLKTDGTEQFSKRLEMITQYIDICELP